MSPLDTCRCTPCTGARALGLGLGLVVVVVGLGLGLVVDDVEALGWALHARGLPRGPLHARALVPACAVPVLAVAVAVLALVLAAGCPIRKLEMSQLGRGTLDTW